MGWGARGSCSGGLSGGPRGNMVSVAAGPSYTHSCHSAEACAQTRSEGTAPVAYWDYSDLNGGAQTSPPPSVKIAASQAARAKGDPGSPAAMEMGYTCAPLLENEAQVLRGFPTQPPSLGQGSWTLLRKGGPRVRGCTPLLKPAGSRARGANGLGAQPHPPQEGGEGHCFSCSQAPPQCPPQAAWASFPASGFSHFHPKW